MQMGNLFSRVFPANPAIFQAYSSWIGAIIESSFNPIITQYIVSIFSQFITEQLCYEYPILSIFSLKTEYDSFGCRLYLVINVSK